MPPFRVVFCACVVACAPKAAPTRVTTAAPAATAPWLGAWVGQDHAGQHVRYEFQADGAFSFAVGGQPTSLATSAICQAAGTFVVTAPPLRFAFTMKVNTCSPSHQGQTVTDAATLAGDTLELIDGERLAQGYPVAPLRLVRAQDPNR